MATIKFNNSQITELKTNQYVKNCTSKSIIFTKNCKLKVLELDKKWIFYREIFKQLWFPKYIVNSKIPENCIFRWKRNISLKWKIEETKWRKKKEYIDTTKMTKDEYIEYLEAKLALMEELEKLSNSGYS